MSGRNRRDDCRAFHAGQGLQHEMRNRRERPGVARAHTRAGAPRVHLIDRDAHRGVLLAADGLARLLVHGDHLSRRQHRGALSYGRRQRRQRRGDHCRLAHQQRLQLWIVRERTQRAGEILVRLMVAAHHVDGDRQHAGPRARSLRPALSPYLRSRRASRAHAGRGRTRRG